MRCDAFSSVARAVSARRAMIRGSDANRRSTIILAAGLTLLVVVLTCVYRFATLGGTLGGFENDEFVTLSLAQQETLGERPLRDFVEVAAPLTVGLSAASLRAIGHTLFAEAALTIGMLALCSAILFLLSWRASGSMTIAFTVALVQIAMAPRFYNYPKLLAYGLAMPALWAYLYRPTRGRLFLVSLTGVIGFLLRFDHGAYLAAAALAAIVAAHWPNVRQSLVDASIAGAMALLLVAPAVVAAQRGMGLIALVQAFLDTAQRAADRTDFKPQPFSFDWSQPAFARERTPPPPPRINVRWRREVTEAARTARAQALGLIDGERQSVDVFNYELRDRSAAALQHIVQDPLVADTQGVDRGTFVLNDPVLLRRPSAFERLTTAVSQVRVLPGVLRADNAVPFVYWLMLLVPIAALAVAALDWYGNARATPLSTSAIAVTALLALLIDWGFLRGNLPSRLADVSEVVGVVAAWLAGRALMQPSKTRRRIAATVLVIVLALTLMSVNAIEGAASQVQVARNGGGIPGLSRRLREVRRQLDAVPPVAAWPNDDPGVERVAWDVNRCTKATDRGSPRDASGSSPDSTPPSAGSNR